MSLPAPLLALVAALAGGCPNDPNDSDDEVDGSGDPLPKDPLDGVGETPTGVPDASSVYPSPATLGNGLVHDSRLLLDRDDNVVSIDITTAGDGVPWAGYVEELDIMSKKGFRPSQIGARVRVEPAGADAYRLIVDDDSVYVSDDDANYLHQVETFLFANTTAESNKTEFEPALAGSRPVSIDSFSVANGSLTGFTVAWVRDEKPVPWKIVAGLERDVFDGRSAHLISQGYRPLSVASRKRGSTEEYAGIFVADGIEKPDWDWSLGVDEQTFASEVDERWHDGYCPFRINTQHNKTGELRFDVLWIARPPELRIAVRYNLDDEHFEDEDRDLRSQGYHLESADVYFDEGERWVATWIRYQPYLRWTGTQFANDDQNYAIKYQPFHDQVIAVMQRSPPLVGDGAFFRPSATLHIMEGDEVVLNRAYTYAPAIYPDTELNAPMRYASVSKSITAAVVVKEMAAKNIPLTTPLVSVLGLSPGDYPAAMGDVSVLSTLRMLGGFRQNPRAYWDHHLILAESPTATLPIDGSELLKHVLLHDLFHPTAPNKSRYWDAADISDAVAYSSPAYTIVGEIIPSLTGFSYRGYTQWFVESQGSDIIPDPEHRYATLGPINAGQGTYLINANHPYRSGAHSTPSQGTSDLPVERWKDSAIPDPDTPARVAWTRYGGGISMSGAPLAAGGWSGDGESLGRLVRGIVNGSAMPTQVADQLWHPQWANMKKTPGPGWAYGLGWYMRGNWVAAAGGTTGSMAIVLHNRAYDITVVMLTNSTGNPFLQFANPLFAINTPFPSPVGKPAPCVNEPRFAQNECLIGIPY